MTRPSSYTFLLFGRGNAFGKPDVFGIGGTALSFSVIAIDFDGVTEIQSDVGVCRAIEPAGPDTTGISRTVTRSLSTSGGSATAWASRAVRSTSTFTIGTSVDCLAQRCDSCAKAGGPQRHKKRKPR